jgi:hypothetical protein
MKKTAPIQAAAKPAVGANGSPAPFPASALIQSSPKPTGKPAPKAKPVGATKAAGKPAVSAKAAAKPAAAAKTVAAKPVAAKPAAAKSAVAKPAAATKPPAAVKPAAAKSVAAAKPIVAKAAVLQPAAAKPAPAKVAEVRAAVAPIVKTSASSKAKADAAAAAKDKARKPKLVRDSFTMPEQEYAVLGQVKKACLKAGFEIKKSELLRVGVALISQIDMATLQNVLSGLPTLKTGRPKKV